VETPVPLIAECALLDLGSGLALARRFTRAVLRAWTCGGAVDDVLLVVTELATNALQHGGGHPLLRLSAGPGGVRVEVFDDDPAPPVRRVAGPGGGWGLALVDRLSPEWGSARHGHGKVVWCAMPATRAG
jgi:anti-sigma regulatory factor (Ser/Thr protein kinase)